MTELKKLDLIYYCFPKTGSSVQSGWRPALVLYKDCEHTLLAAITSQKKNHLPTHVMIGWLKHTANLKDTSSILFEQLFWVKTPEHAQIIGHVDQINEEIIDHALGISVGIKAIPNRKRVNPEVHRGQVYDINGQKFVVVQNNVGNNFSPTTIVGILDRVGNISGVQTIPQRVLPEKAAYRIHDTSKRIVRFMPELYVDRHEKCIS